MHSLNCDCMRRIGDISTCKMLYECMIVQSKLNMKVYSCFVAWDINPLIYVHVIHRFCNSESES